MIDGLCNRVAGGGLSYEAYPYIASYYQHSNPPHAYPLLTPYVHKMAPIRIERHRIRKQVSD